MREMKHDDPKARKKLIRVGKELFPKNSCVPWITYYPEQHKFRALTFLDDKYLQLSAFCDTVEQASHEGIKELNKLHQQSISESK